MAETVRQIDARLRGALQRRSEASAKILDLCNLVGELDREVDDLLALRASEHEAEVRQRCAGG